MKKLEELINSDEHFVDCYSLMLPIKKQIKELAIAYAKICLEKAANEATLCYSGYDKIEETDLTGCSNDYGSYWINKKSITNIELP